MFVLLKGAFTITICYLLGSIPFAYLMGKFLRGIDIREHGSGNLGATNVARTLGVVPGIVTLLLDGLKGLVSVIIIAPFFFVHSPAIEWVKIACGVAAIFGHNWTCFLSFKGGKGVATSTGVFLGLAPIAIIFSIFVWLVVWLIWRYVSLASIIAALCFPIFLFFLDRSAEMFMVGIMISAIGIWKHRANIKRLLEGSEPKSFTKVKGFDS
ncbi:MAG: glycerol-3-phosphate 1-O-acyltransferase PlsY [Chlamydiota bacterium]|nr:glycerol-3-phosphate 1-O-acyltransferase PlsY [Chlamydiota bacterium]